MMAWPKPAVEDFPVAMGWFLVQHDVIQGKTND
jgi:hypothetical protein